MRPVSGAIVSVGALLQAAIMVGRLRAAAGEPDATGCRASGDSPAPGLDDAAGGAAGGGGGAAGDAGGPGGGWPGRRRA